MGNDQIQLFAGLEDGDTECITVNAVDNDRLDNGNIITLSIDDSDLPTAEVQVFDDDSKLAMLCTFYSINCL